MKSTDKLDKWDSTPVINLAYMKCLPAADEKWVKDALFDLTTIYHKGGFKSSIAWARATFGKQHYVWKKHNGRKMHVWELENECMRVFAHSVKGISFEIKFDLEPEQQLAIFKEFANKFLK
jgi:hypothetical protein